jgi:hypothetical protein
MKLYELTNDYLALLDAIDNGEIPEEAIADTLEAITEEIESKADSIACVLKNLDADIIAIKAEEVRLAERRKAKEKSYERIKQYLSETLQAAGLDKIETARNKITFRKSESVEIDEDAFIIWAQKNRDDLLTYSAPKVNKAEVKKSLKNGDSIVGAELRINSNIQLK